MKRENIYEGVLSFKGTWRNYQNRVLEEADKYLEDGKIHIVAAPGAGKTTLGIELIRRTGQPCLIFSPRIVIREQWLERIRQSFLTEEKNNGLLSNNLKSPALITSVTYQTLYSSVKGYQGTEEEQEGEEPETVDFSDFQLLETVRKAGIRTICLDECHHLKNEWWKALESFMQEMKDVTVISLTATPPYDSTPAQWERYIRMCGEIDTEITIPELVKEGSLCPHQDYVYFSYPAGDEERQLEQFRMTSDEMFEEVLGDSRLREAAASHKALLDYENYFDQMLENPAYLSSLLIYCQCMGISFSPAPFIEFFYKSDEEGDSSIDRRTITTFDILTIDELHKVESYAKKIGKSLSEFYNSINVELIDFRVEFGRSKKNGEILLAGDISPDTCQLIDTRTGKSLEYSQLSKKLDLNLN